jgi:hypothetical protein
VALRIKYSQSGIEDKYTRECTWHSVYTRYIYRYLSGIEDIRVALKIKISESGIEDKDIREWH